MLILVRSPWPSVGGREGNGATFLVSELSIIDTELDVYTDNIGSNALPPGLNLTVFQQFEQRQTDPSIEVKTCTWKAVQDRKAVSLCKNK